MPGAMVSVVCISAMNRSVREFGLVTPAEILTKTRELVIETFEKSDREVKDGMDISICALNSKTNELEYAGANNPLYHLKKLDGTENKKSVTNGKYFVSEIKADKEPIGNYSNMTPFTNHKVQLDKGDLILLSSDGYADQFGGPKGKKFMYKPFKKLMLENMNQPLQKQKELLESAFESWRGDLEQVDDVCVIGVQI